MGSVVQDRAQAVNVVLPHIQARQHRVEERAKPFVVVQMALYYECVVEFLKVWLQNVDLFFLHEARHSGSFNYR